MGPATPTDEVPNSPLWADAGPYDGGQDGDLEVEWARCTALDLASTRIYTSTSQMTDILGLSPTADLPPSEGNTTVLSLDAGKPYWLGLTCVDEAGQEDWQNATIIGPVVPTGGLNDNTPPDKLENVAAIDTPVVEVHISNTFNREEFRHQSFVAPHTKGVIVGFGLQSYELALQSF